MEYLECWKQKWGTTRFREKFFDLSWIRTTVLRIISSLPHRLNYEARWELLARNRVIWYKITRAGVQVAQWDFQNQASRTSPPWPAFVLEVPLCFCVTACVILYDVTGSCVRLITVVIRSKFWKYFPASNISVDWSNILLEIVHLEWISLACSTCLLYFLSGSSTCHRSSEMVWYEALGNPLGQLPVTRAHTVVLRQLYSSQILHPSCRPLDAFPGAAPTELEGIISLLHHSICRLDCSDY